MRRILCFTLLFMVLSLPGFCLAATFQGIDVSDWQGYIDYSEVRNAGIEIVYIKASQGNSIVDQYFRINYNNAKANGLKVGLYHFLTAKTVQEAENQAQYFASSISGTSPDCKLAMDFEVFGDLTSSQINEISFAFLRRVQELTGKEVIVYSDASNARNTFSQDIANTYPLWVAEYGVSSPDTGNWNSYEGFQYSDKGRIAGISGFTDLDIFTNSIFLSSPNNISTPQNSVNQFRTYTVRRGNTLSQIARLFGTTVREIAGLNNIPNPNLIFVGQVLRIDVTNDFSVVTSDKYETNHIIYTIRRGDTLTAIARIYGVTIQSIVDLNNIANPNLIFAGERLRINL